MEKTRLGRTNLQVTRTAFGALPIQRIDLQKAKYILRKAYQNGINFFDTARAYSDSEEKIGHALADVRNEIIIATKSQAKTAKELLEDVETSLNKLQTDYIDILQLHNPISIPYPDDNTGLYNTLKDLQKRGIIRFLGVTNHRLNNASEAVRSGLYDTVQFPLSSLSTSEDLSLVAECRQHDIGLIAMKGMSGGLITNAATTFAFLRQYQNVVPIWGIQHEWELDDFLALAANPPKLDDEMMRIIEKDRQELAGSFCRGCGYCMPCPVGIPINTAARLSLLVQRGPYEQFLTPEWQRKMQLIEQCRACGQCKNNCPYELDTPQLLKQEYRKYQDFLTEHLA